MMETEAMETEMMNTAQNSDSNDDSNANLNNTKQTQYLAASPQPSYCQKLFNWFPLRPLSFIGGVALTAVPILDIFIPPPVLNPVKWFIYIYLIIFGIVIMFIEAPSFICTRRFQLGIFFWARWLSRMWGRAVFYSFVSFFCYSQGVFILLVGVYLSTMSLLNLLFSLLSSRKFGRMRQFIAAGTEGDALKDRFRRKYIELEAAAKDQKVGSAEIIKIAEEAGKVLSNAERHAIQTFLDESCNGYVTKEDWMKQFVEQYEEKGFKQKFL